MNDACPCGSARKFSECCEPFLQKARPAPTPEALMRSRYTAFARKDFDYILATTDPQRRFDFDHEATRDWMNNSTFTSLEVLGSTDLGNKGTVEFIAKFRDSGGGEQTHHEHSRFRKQAGVWYFSDGRVVAPRKQ